MTIFSKELEQRLKKLELEQHDQELTLNDLSNLEQEIRELEEILAKINDSYTLAMKEPESDYSHLRDLSEIEKFERKLARIDEEFEQQSLTKEPEPPKANIAKPSPPSPKHTTATPVAAPAGYVICLMFNPKAPPEWSGKGWCEPGKGMRYTNPALAKHILQKLKNQWPDYPLKIFKR
ncbi:MAG: hypothetical protein HC877_16920 [Thioploca sp.]|nr:hypothetical protein [Thioploca sp.]